MRDLNTLNRYRRRDRHVIENWGWAGDSTCGMFMIPSPLDQRIIAVVASSGAGWDHVSVSREKRCPNWHEMEFIARLFFADDEVAMQLHVPAADHVCLHWWRPLDVEIPLPDAILVGLKDRGVLTAETVGEARAAAAALRTAATAAIAAVRAWDEAQMQRADEPAVDGAEPPTTEWVELHRVVKR